MNQVSVLHLPFRNLPPSPKLKKKASQSPRRPNRRARSSPHSANKARDNLPPSPPRLRSMIWWPWASLASNALRPSERPSETSKGPYNTSSTASPRTRPRVIPPPPACLPASRTIHNFRNFAPNFRATPTPFPKSWDRSARLPPTSTTYLPIHLS